MKSNTRVLFASASILLIALLAGCGNKTPTVQVIDPQDGAILANTAIQFAAVAEDPEDDPLTYRWLFGDGGNSTDQSVSHTYSEGGDYTVNLAVSDGKHTVQAAIKIHINIRPSSRISWEAGEDSEWNTGPIEGTAPLYLEFDGSSSWDADGRVVSHEWVFHDGTTVSGPSCEYTYDTPGRYSVGLRVVDDLGASAEHSIDVVIHPSLAQSLETVRSLELMLSPLRSDILTTMFPFSREVLQVQQNGSLLYDSIGGRQPLWRALNYKTDGCSSIASLNNVPTIQATLMRECEQIQRNPVSAAFAAALACEEAGCSDDCARLVLGFEELLFLTEQASSLLRYVHLSTESETGARLTLDTSKVPGALLQLPSSFFYELAYLNEEFGRLTSSGQETDDWVAAVDSFPAAWGEVAYETTEQLRVIDGTLPNVLVDSLAAHLDTLNTEHEASLLQIAGHVRNLACSQQLAQVLHGGTYQDRVEFGIVFDNSIGNKREGQLGLVYSLDSPDEGSPPIEFAIFQRNNAWVVRAVPHTQIKTTDLQYVHPDLWAAHEMHGPPSAIQIEPYYEIQYEVLAFGWYIRPTWTQQPIQAGVYLAALFSVRNERFSQEGGNCTISLAPSPTNAARFVDLEVCFATSFVVVPGPLPDFTLALYSASGDEGYIGGVSGNVYHEYRVVSPGTYP